MLLRKLFQGEKNITAQNSVCVFRVNNNIASPNNNTTTTRPVPGAISASSHHDPRSKLTPLFHAGQGEGTACRAGRPQAQVGTPGRAPPAQAAPSHSGIRRQRRVSPEVTAAHVLRHQVSSQPTAGGSLRATVLPSYSGVTCPSEHQPIDGDTAEPPNHPGGAPPRLPRSASPHRPPTPPAR